MQMSASIDQLSVNHPVAGSSPARGANINKGLEVILKSPLSPVFIIGASFKRPSTFSPAILERFHLAAAPPNIAPGANQ